GDHCPRAIKDDGHLLPKTPHGVLGSDLIQADAARSSRAIRCTVPTPTPTSRAILMMPLSPPISAARIAASVLLGIRLRPIGFPLFVPFRRARAIPARLRSSLMLRSNSAKTPSI